MRICLIIVVALFGVNGIVLAQEAPPATSELDAATQRENPNTNIPYESGRRPPTCEDRWSNFLPIWGQAACQQGYVLPRPFGLSLGVMHQDQPFDVNAVTVNLGGLSSSDIASVSNVQNEETTVTLRADVWLMPFWNVYAIGGRTDGEAVGDLAINLGICALPNACPNKFTLDYEADVIGVGTTVAGGYKDFFGMIDINRTKADLDISVTDAYATVISGRLGWNGKLGLFTGVLWVGAMYQDIAQELTLETRVGSGNTLLQVIIDQETAEPLNYVVGGQWDFTRSLSALFELGVGKRKSQMLNLTYRF
jgi:hypothetical protein